MSQILFSYPSVPSNFKNLIFLPDVGFISTPETPFKYINGDKHLKGCDARFDLIKPFIIGRNRCDKEKDLIIGTSLKSKFSPLLLSSPTDILISRNSPKLTNLDSKRCEEIYNKYEEFVNTNRHRLVATVAHSEVELFFLASRKFRKNKPRVKLTIKGLDSICVTEIYNNKFSLVMPLFVYKDKGVVEISKENFEITFNFPTFNIFWRDDFYLKIYSSGLLEFIPVKYNFSLFMKGNYSVLKEHKEDDDIKFVKVV
jgi:hypothetical protein